MPLPIYETKQEYVVYFAEQAAKGIPWESDIDDIISQGNYVALSVLLDPYYGYMSRQDTDEINSIIRTGDRKLITALVSGGIVLDEAQLTAIISMNLDTFGEAAKYGAILEGEEKVNQIIIHEYNSNLTPITLETLIDTADEEVISSLLQEGYYPELTSVVYDKAISEGEFDVNYAKAAWSSSELSDEERKELIQAAIDSSSGEFLSSVVYPSWGTPSMGSLIDSKRVYKECLREIFDARQLLSEEALIKLIDVSIFYEEKFPGDVPKANFLLKKEQMNDAFEAVVNSYVDAKHILSDPGYFGWNMYSVYYVPTLQDAIEIMMRKEGGEAGDNKILTDEFIIDTIMKPGREDVALEFARQFILEGRLDMVALMYARADGEFRDKLGNLEIGKGELLSEIAEEIPEEQRGDKGKEWVSEALDPNNGVAVTISDLAGTYIDGNPMFTEAEMDKLQLQSPVHSSMTNNKHSKFKLP